MKTSKKRTTSAALSLLFSGTLLSGGMLSPNVMGQEAGSSALGPDLNAFAFDFYREIGEGTGQNVLISPLSLCVAFGMVYGGAEGQTAQEIAEAFCFRGSKEDVHSSFGELMKRLNPQGDDAPYELSVANALWVQKNFSLLDSYLALTSDVYDASASAVDFSRSVEAAATINRWVEAKTNDRIKDLIKPSHLNALTRLVLTNAVYFKGAWQHPFTKDATRDLPFHLIGGTSVPVPTMHLEETLSFSRGNGIAAIELPYKGGDLSLVIVVPDSLPNTPEAFRAFEKGMSADRLREIVQGMEYGRVVLSMPKFKLEASMSLAATMRALGVEAAFSDGLADFSGISKQGDLYITEVVQKTFIDVNEVGTEAAAATGIVMGIKSIPRRPTPFKVDRPFLFFLQEREQGRVLFMGRVTNPAATE